MKRLRSPVVNRALQLRPAGERQFPYATTKLEHWLKTFEEQEKRGVVGDGGVLPEGWVCKGTGRFLRTCPKLVCQRVTRSGGGQYGGKSHRRCTVESTSVWERMQYGSMCVCVCRTA